MPRVLRVPRCQGCQGCEGALDVKRAQTRTSVDNGPMAFLKKQDAMDARLFAFYRHAGSKC